MADREPRDTVSDPVIALSKHRRHEIGLRQHAKTISCASYALATASKCEPVLRVSPGRNPAAGVLKGGAYVSASSAALMARPSVPVYISIVTWMLECPAKSFFTLKGASSNVMVVCLALWPVR